MTAVALKNRISSGSKPELRSGIAGVWFGMVVAMTTARRSPRMNSVTSSPRRMLRYTREGDDIGLVSIDRALRVEETDVLTSYDVTLDNGVVVEATHEAVVEATGVLIPAEPGWRLHQHRPDPNPHGLPILAWLWSPLGMAVLTPAGVTIDDGHAELAISPPGGGPLIRWDMLGWSIAHGNLAEFRDAVAAQRERREKQWKKFTEGRAS
jgi:hypothetical protein